MPSRLSRRAAILVSLVAVGTYANSVLTGFAYDDNIIIVGRLLVTEGRAVEGLTAAYWPEAVSGTGLYRPVTLSSFALEWGLWNGHPAGFHPVNLAVHTALSLLVFSLILQVSATLPALVGGALVAAHTVRSNLEFHGLFFDSFLAGLGLSSRGRTLVGRRPPGFPFMVSGRFMHTDPLRRLRNIR